MNTPTQRAVHVRPTDVLYPTVWSSSHSAFRGGMMLPLIWTVSPSHTRTHIFLTCLARVELYICCIYSLLSIKKFLLSFTALMTTSRSDARNLTSMICAYLIPPPPCAGLGYRASGRLIWHSESDTHGVAIFSTNSITHLFRLYVFFTYHYTPRFIFSLLVGLSPNCLTALHSWKRPTFHSPA
jgi:hypothetical protein